MTKRFLIVVIALMFLPAIGGEQLYAAAPQRWETVKGQPQGAKLVAHDGSTEIWVAARSVTVVARQQTEVRVYTILGQLVSRETVAAGSWRMHFSSRGIYIIKTGEITAKVAV